MITVGRILSVPLIVWCLLIEARMAAFVIFIVAGISDSVDGIIARHFDQDTELGAYLDPIADKGLLISVFVVLGYLGHIPLWLVVLAVSRDVLIVAGVMLAFLLGSPMDNKQRFDGINKKANGSKFSRGLRLFPMWKISISFLG
ncbi:MAG: CDP-alcohol phosphatidyltransferase family protein [Pseudomonadota bacterium]